MRKVAAVIGALWLGELAQAVEAAPDFAQTIVPIFEASCIECHGARKQKGKLRLDTKEGAMRKEDIIAAGSAEGSELYLRITLPEDDPDRMPNEGAPLTPAQTNAIRAWINQGAVWPDGLVLNHKIRDASESYGLPAVPPAAAGESEAIANLAASGINVLPLATNVGWRAANLRPFGVKVNDELMKQISRIPTLIHLDLGGTSVGDVGVAQLAKLKNLSRLHLERTGVTDDGLALLAGLAKLEYLNLYGTAVTDAGLEHLRGLKKLQRLYLSETKTTEEGRSELQQFLPQARIMASVVMSTPVQATPDTSNAANQVSSASPVKEPKE